MSQFIDLPLGTVVLDKNRLRWVYLGSRPNLTSKGGLKHTFVVEVASRKIVGGHGWEQTFVKDETLIKHFPELKFYMPGTVP